MKMQVAVLQYDVTKLKQHIGADWPDYSPDAEFVSALVRPCLPQWPHAQYSLDCACEGLRELY